MSKLGLLALLIPLATSLNNVVFHRDAKYIPQKLCVCDCCWAQFDFEYPSKHPVPNKRLYSTVVLCLTIKSSEVCTASLSSRHSRFLTLDGAASCSSRHKSCLLRPPSPTMS